MSNAGIATRLWLATLLLLAGCAQAPNGDPYEAANREIFSFNQKMDRAVARPVAEFYVRAAPDRLRLGIHNALTNLNAPVVFANELLQARVGDAGETALGFVANSTLGLGGLVDIASRLNLPAHDNDFGVTLGRWGVGEGPYLVLPFLGPAPPRDLTGKAADVFLDPLFYVSYRGKTYVDLGVGTLNVVDWRARNIETLDDIERTSIDVYAATRSLYLQYRKGEVEGEGAGTPGDP